MTPVTPPSTQAPEMAISRRSLSSRIAKFLRCEGGGPASEFSLIAAPFFALILAILQVSLIYFAQESLETAVEQTARLVLTGQAQSQNLTQSQFATSLCNNSPGMFTCSNFMIDLQPASTFANVNVSKPSLTYDAGGNVTNTWQYNMGNPGDIMVMRVMYRWPVFLGPLGLNLSNLPNNMLLLMATSVFRNEP